MITACCLVSNSSGKKKAKNFEKGKKEKRNRLNDLVSKIPTTGRRRIYLIRQNHSSTRFPLFFFLPSHSPSFRVTRTKLMVTFLVFRFSLIHAASKCMKKQELCTIASRNNQNRRFHEKNYFSFFFFSFPFPIVRHNLFLSSTFPS